MPSLRILVASLVVGGLVMLMLRCAGAPGPGGDAVGPGRNPAEALRQAELAMGRPLSPDEMVRHQAEVDARTGGRVVATLAPGETWRGTFTVKLPLESFSRDGSTLGGGRMYRDLELRVVQNDWREAGVSVSTARPRVESYGFDIWQLERDGKTLIPQASDRRVDLEALGRLSRDEFLQADWQEDPRRQGFDPEWDLRRGRGHGYRATLGVTISAPTTLAGDVTRGNIHLASNHTRVGLALSAYRDPPTGNLIVREGPLGGGKLVCNPLRNRFDDAW
jgi:hypothetical protein